MTIWFYSQYYTINPPKKMKPNFTDFCQQALEHSDVFDMKQLHTSIPISHIPESDQWRRKKTDERISA